MKRTITITIAVLVLGCALVLSGYTGSIEEAAEEASSGFPLAAGGVNVWEVTGSHPRRTPRAMQPNPVSESISIPVLPLSVHAPPSLEGMKIR